MGETPRKLRAQEAHLYPCHVWHYEAFPSVFSRRLQENATSPKYSTVRYGSVLNFRGLY